MNSTDYEYTDEEIELITQLTRQFVDGSFHVLPRQPIHITKQHYIDAENIYFDLTTGPNNLEHLKGYSGAFNMRSILDCVIDANTGKFKIGFSPDFSPSLDEILALHDKLETYAPF